MEDASGPKTTKITAPPSISHCPQDPGQSEAFSGATMSEETSTVFVVDDDDAVHRALTRLIRSAGYCVEPFAAARELLESRP
jgi:hypothetical protein